MHILNYQSFVETRQQLEEFFGSDIIALNDTPSDKTLTGKKGLLKENFEQFAVEYPDGRAVTLYQDGRITETPKDGKENKDMIMDIKMLNQID